MGLIHNYRCKEHWSRQFFAYAILPYIVQKRFKTLSNREISIWWGCSHILISSFCQIFEIFLFYLVVAIKIFHHNSWFNSQTVLYIVLKAILENLLYFFLVLYFIWWYYIGLMTLSVISSRSWSPCTVWWGFPSK